MHRRYFLPVVLLWLLLAANINSATARHAAAPTSILNSFSARVEFARKQLPLTTQAADAAAARIAANPTALINVPYGDQPGFAEEVLNRAGGLANTLPFEERPTLVTPKDIMLISARSWQEDTPKVRKWIEKSRKEGWLIFLFASRAGMPADLRADYLIDNGASTAGAAEAPINTMANALNMWLWTCEYAAGLTRRGKYPGVLLSIIMPESKAHNAALQGPEIRRFLGDIRAPIAPQALSRQYLKRVAVLQKALADARTQNDISRAANIVTQYLAAGKTVGVATCTHILMSEIFENRKTPMKPFNAVHQAAQAFPTNLKEGDLVVWLGYVGMSTEYEDYATPMRKTGAKIISSYVTDKNPANNAPDAVSHIEQHWSPPDAAVKVPFAPGVIAPISGLDQVLIYRMLEETVAARLVLRPANLPRPVAAPAVRALAATTPATTPVTTPATEYVCRKTVDAIKLDGVLDEQSWRKATATTAFTRYREQPGDTRHTEAKLLWDDEKLYVAITAFDTDIRASRRHRDDDVFAEDCVEFFVMEQYFKERYNHFLEYQINALGTRTDAYNIATYAGIVGWDSTGWQCAVKVDGTVNDGTDRDRSWTVEMSIPFNDFHAVLYRTTESASRHIGKKFQGFTPAPGSRWGANIYRCLLYTSPSPRDS